MMDHFPTSDLHIDAQLLISKTLGAQEKYEEQFDLLLRVLKENIIPERVPIIYTQIAEFYEKGLGVKQNIAKALYYYRKALSGEYITEHTQERAEQAIKRLKNT